jgi:outer membrane protein OmpA-like peptidoglycan-associated protein
MKRIKLILPILAILIPVNLIGQSRYGVTLAKISSSKYDEFCPVIHKDQLVFCSNLEHELLITYQNKKNMGLFNLFMVTIDPESGQEDPKILSKNLVTPFNDGPAAFNKDGTLLVYSRNIDINAKAKNIFDQSNNLGLYFAELKNGEWIPSAEFPFNNVDFSITTPCFSPDGQYLYFGSDMPGGFGGADLYRSELVDGEWYEPVNLGPSINTKGNEVYPFIAGNGDLFFASDGHGGLGKKDIFVSRLYGSEWITPVDLEAPINSEEDDFGLITDYGLSEGYFSSSRGTTDDIYQFETLIPQLFDCDTMLENNYCFQFWDDEYPGIDSLPVVYEWIFSDGTNIRGLTVEHCFPGPGKHWAKLNIIDNTTSNTFFTQNSMEFELEDHVQPYITSRDVGIINTTMEFNGLNSYVPEFSIEEFIWEYGDESFETGTEVKHSYEKTGTYNIKLGLTGFTKELHEKETRCVIKPITIVADNQTLAMYLAGIESHVIEEMEETRLDSGEVQQDFSVFDVNPEEEVFRVEVLASEDKIMLEDPLFDPLRDQYEIKEFYISRDSVYSYTVGEFEALLNTYKVYNDVVEIGFSSATVRTYVLAELPTEVIAKINRDFAHFSNANFEFNKTDVSETSYSILDRVATIMKENPDLALEIAAHTDNVGSFEFNLDLSEKRVQSIVRYLVSKGIDATRLEGNGYGEARPIADNGTEEGRMKNRRVEFLILNK